MRVTYASSQPAAIDAPLPRSPPRRAGRWRSRRSRRGSRLAPRPRRAGPGRRAAANGPKGRAASDRRARPPAGPTQAPARRGRSERVRPARRPAGAASRPHVRAGAAPPQAARGPLRAWCACDRGRPPGEAVQPLHERWTAGAQAEHEASLRRSLKARRRHRNRSRRSAPDRQHGRGQSDSRGCAGDTCQHHHRVLRPPLSSAETVVAQLLRTLRQPDGRLGIRLERRYTGTDSRRSGHHAQVWWATIPPMDG